MKKSVAKKRSIVVKEGKNRVQKIVKKVFTKAVKKKVIKKEVAGKKVVRKKVKSVVRGKGNNDNSLIITAALPYANGAIHIGHLLEYIQADMYARFWRLLNRDVLYICASDMHGTPIEVNAAKEGMKPEVFVEKYWKEHQHDFKTFLIQFDEYYKTHSSENKELAEMFYTVLQKKGYIYHKKIPVMFCDGCNRSLPDRFVKGECPKCHVQDQYGDVCESCGSVLKSFDLIKPFCVICKNTPVRKEKEHYFFKLSAFNTQLQGWLLSQEGLQPEMRNWLLQWFEKGLEDWCISREAPYFGFEIPGCREEIGEVRYFYVWLDAPIGYISSTKHYCERMFGEKGGKWEKYWYKGEIQHFIGKDIAYFHFLFWPAMLMAMGISMPNFTVHGFITVNGQKMSKSRGTFFTARDFVALYPVEALRFYYASHLDRKLVDVDLSFPELTAVNNNVLMGSLGNFCYRVLTFAQKNYGAVDSVAEEKELNALIMGLVVDVRKAYEAQDFRLAVRGVLQIADAGNAYFQQSEVWKNKDSDVSRAKVGWCVNLARNLAVLVSPVLPEFSGKVLNALGLGGRKIRWDDISFGWKGRMNVPELLVKKIEVVEEKAQFPLQMMIGEIISVVNHPNADSLYLLKVDFGTDSGFANNGVRQVVAGLKKFLKFEELQGKKVVFCVNMKPAKLRGEMSEAMVLAVDDTVKLGLLQFEGCEKGDSVMFEGMKRGEKGDVGYEEFTKLKMEIIARGVVYEGRKLKAVKNGKNVMVTAELKDGARVK
jgi:methionyl-tRNA synthetase